MGSNGMTTENNLSRFVEAQKGAYETALAEVKNGWKTSHWMWFIFPQVRGLGFSDTAKFYAIKDLAEAAQYLGHPVLGARLVEISAALLDLGTTDPVKIFGHTDSMKLKSSMTLFSLPKNRDPVFQKVLNKFFGGAKDERTLQLVGS